MTSSSNTPDLTNADWFPTDQEETDILEAAARRVAWEKAMAAQGIMVLRLGLTPEEEEARIDAWVRSSPDAQQFSSER